MSYKVLQLPVGEAEEGEATTEDGDVYLNDYDILIANGVVDGDMFSEIFSSVSTNIKHEKVLLVLVTYGGDPNHAYRIGRYLQSVYKEVAIFVPSICKSAGTLIACAGHHLIMTPWGEIGPLDIQLHKEDEIGRQRSGLTMRSAMEELKDYSLELFEHFAISIVAKSEGAISFKLAAEIAAYASSDIMAAIYGQITPAALGQDARDVAIASAYCKRLNKKSRNLKANGINKLVQEFPSHNFVIDAEEAKEIFQRVKRPSPALYQLFIQNVQLLGTPFNDKLCVDMIELISSVEVDKDDAHEETPNESHQNSTQKGNNEGTQPAA